MTSTTALIVGVNILSAVTVGSISMRISTLNQAALFVNRELKS